MSLLCAATMTMYSMIEVSDSFGSTIGIHLDELPGAMLVSPDTTYRSWRFLRASIAAPFIEDCSSKTYSALPSIHFFLALMMDGLTAPPVM